MKWNTSSESCFQWNNYASQRGLGTGVSLYAYVGFKDISHRWYNCKDMYHDDVIKWKHFPRYWTLVQGIHRSPVNSPHKGQWRRALIFSSICVCIKGWVNNREAGDFRRHRAHDDVIVMIGRKNVPAKTSWQWTNQIRATAYKQLLCRQF